MPQGVVSSSLKGQGKLVTYDEGSTLQVFSSVTRKWHAISKTPASSVRLFNDCVVILEPNSCCAFSSHTGRSEAITTTNMATLLNVASHRNDSIVLVQSGLQLHAFSAFTGTWTSRTTTANVSATAQRHVAVLHDGPVLAAMSAFGGDWRDYIHGTNITGIGADGTVATASSVALNFAFSAHTGAWRTAPAMSNATFARGDDWAMWLANGTAHAFSGLCGSFVSDTSGATAIAGSTDLYALLTTPTGVRAFSAVTGDLISIASGAATIDLGGAAALLHDSTTITGYSPLRQQSAQLTTAAASSGAGNTIAFATDASGQSFAWSSLTASWHAAPASANGSPPILTTTTVGITTPADAYAFAARTGQFVPCGRPLAGLAANPTSAPLLGYDATCFIAFDTDAERWVQSARTSNSPPIFSIWRTSALVLDDSTAHGFGAQAAAWQQHNVQSASASVIANSEVACVVTSHHVAACSMLPEIVAFQQFPHFRRVQPRGSPISFVAAPADAAFAIAAFAQPTAPIVVPGFGTLMLDANHAFLVPVIVTAKRPAARVTLQIPADLGLSGSTLASQLVVLPPAAPPYLSDRATVSIW